ncbi:MAG TPA: hypothetical protein VK927_07710 [Adhaeribacter sp.]|nr:hypothetical protein [Adhaeribacter sp.]
MAGAFFMLCLLFTGFSATAQVTPADTTKAKPELPTAPTAPEYPDYQPPVIVAPEPEKLPEKSKAEKGKKEKVESDIDRRWFLNGNIELFFGNVTYLNLAPAFGYRITEKWAIGPGVKYEFINYYGEQYHNYGAKLFTQYVFAENFFAHSELEVLNVKDTEYVNGYKVRDFRRTIGVILMGAGYRQYIGDRASADMMLLLNLNDNIYSPYHNPVIRVGFNIDL